jgi:membrane-bound lytic murein transglycosylase D
MRLHKPVTIALLLLSAACAQLPPEVQKVEAPGPRFDVARTPAVDAAPAAQPVQPFAPAGPEVLAPITIVPPQLTKAPPPQTTNSLWVRLRKGFVLSSVDNSHVTDWENWYSSRPDYVARMVERSSRYLYHIAAEVERRGMPAEIALLPMIESAYNPVAYSKSHASGIWQFIPSTGKHYGLRQNWWYDGRRDIIAATSAALDYLEKLHKQFGSWDLALASYNWGEGSVSRAMAKNSAKGLPTDYDSLTMPAETRQYVPKLVAVKNIIANPGRYGLNLADIPNEPYFETITLSRHIDVKLAAKLAEMEVEEFKYLNPAHNKPVIMSKGTETIVLPKDKARTFRANLESNDKPLVTWQAYTVKAGERPEKIAAKYGITLEKLNEINGITGRKKMTTGLALLVPVSSGAEPNLPDLPATPITLRKAIKASRYANNANGKRSTHVVRTKAKVGGKKTFVAKAAGKRVKVVVQSKPGPAKRVVVAEKR